jgi:hypothetical protein
MNKKLKEEYKELENNTFEYASLIGLASGVMSMILQSLFTNLWNENTIFSFLGHFIFSIFLSVIIGFLFSGVIIGMRSRREIYLENLIEDEKIIKGVKKK